MDVSMESAGLTDLFRSLADRFAPGSKTHQRYGRPSIMSGDRARTRRHMRSTLYDVLLFKSRQNAHRLKHHGDDLPKLNEVNQLLGHVFMLRCQRKYDEASCLEALVDRIKASVESDDALRAMLQIILRLADSGEKRTENVIGHQGVTLPVVCKSKASVVLLPDGPLSYNQTRVSRSDSRYYTHYPSEIFRASGVISDCATSTTSTTYTPDYNDTLWKSLPGQGLSKFFSNEDTATAQARNAANLYGALVQSRLSPVQPWTRLQIPSLDEHSDVFRIRVPCRSPTLTDEGLASCDLSPAVNSSINNDSRDDVWEQALKLPSRKPNTSWEYSGMLSPPQFTPYLSESGAEALNHLYWYHQDLLCTVDSTFVPVRQLYVSAQHLLKDVFYLMMGIPSRIFHFEERTITFTLAPGVCISGTTPEAMALLLAPFQTCGAHYWRLRQFSLPVELNSFYDKGLVFQGLTTAVRKYLRFYEAFLLSLPRHNGITAAANFCQDVFKQMTFLAELCRVSVHDGPRTDGGPEFPTGLSLLSYIYGHALASSASQNYLLLLSILRTTAAPYIHFIQKWVYHGVCTDPYEEFMIRVNNDYLFCRDKYYWSSGYELLGLEALGREAGVLPLFLRDIMTEIFDCGKAINLLKLCSADHFMCNVSENSVPTISVTFSADKLAHIRASTTAYVSRMEEVTRQRMVSRREILERAERARYELIQKGRQQAMERIKQAKAENLQTRTAIEEKKRRQFALLKAQMQQNAERKHGIVLAQKADDKAYMDSLVNSAAARTELELRLEEQARQEIIKQYERMTAQALLRERRALWKVERHKLTELRNRTIADEQRRQEDEYQALMAEQKLSSPVSLNLLEITLNENLPTTVTQSHSADESFAEVELANLLEIGIDQTPPTNDALASTVVAGQRNLLDITVGHDYDHGLSDVSMRRVRSAPPGRLATGTGTVRTDDEAGAIDKPVTLPFHATTDSADHATSDSADHATTDPDDHATSDSADHATTDPVAHATTDPAVDDVGENSQRSRTNVVKLTVNAESEEGKWRPMRKAVSGQNITNISEFMSSDNLTQKNRLKNEKSKSCEWLPAIVDLAEPIRGATDQTVEKVAKSTIKAVAGCHVSKAEVCWTDTASDSYLFTVPSLRPADDILNETVSDTSFEINRRRSTTSFIAKRELPRTPVKAPLPDTDQTRILKFKKMNVHGHPSETTSPQADVVTKSSRTSEQTTSADERDKIVRFQTRNKHGHPSVARIDLTTAAAPANDWISENQRQYQANSDDIMTAFLNQKMKLHHVSDESRDVDVNDLKIRKFQARNVRGHSSQSSVQTLLYGKDFGLTGSDVTAQNTDDQGKCTDTSKDANSEFVPWYIGGVERYKDDYREVYDVPGYDMAARVYNTSSTFEDIDAEEITAQDHMSLPVIIRRSIVAPILAQISLTNRSIVTYFFQDLSIDRHFEALKMYMFLEDGEFGQTLGDVLFDKLSHDPLPHEIFNTVFLSGALMKALSASNLAATMPERLMFTSTYLPKTTDMNGARALDCLDLHYHVDWPLNIIITDSCLSRYNMVFCLMLQLKRVAWCLNDIWHRLKREALLHLGSNLSQLRQLQLYRHEMQNFVRVLQAYLSNQIIHVSWSEFQQDLMNKVHNLDELHDVHAAYLNKAVFRCLLSKKAGSMMKVIQDILGLILRFHVQLMSAGWQRQTTGSARAAMHPAYQAMKSSYKTFKDYSMFLFKVIRKVTARGYQRHLEELLLRLDYNDYYTSGGQH